MKIRIEFDKNHMFGLYQYLVNIDIIDIDNIDFTVTSRTCELSSGALKDFQKALICITEF